jgi:putative effector of murein hydrolase LrgA (UPF0299 family)
MVALKALMMAVLLVPSMVGLMADLKALMMAEMKVVWMAVRLADQ